MDKYFDCLVAVETVVPLNGVPDWHTLEVSTTSQVLSRKLRFPDCEMRHSPFARKDGFFIHLITLQIAKPVELEISCPFDRKDTKLSILAFSLRHITKYLKGRKEEKTPSFPS